MAWVSKEVATPVYCMGHYWLSVRVYCGKRAEGAVVDGAHRWYCCENHLRYNASAPVSEWFRRIREEATLDCLRNGADL